MLLLWLNILRQFWIEYDVVALCISTHLTFQVSQGSAATDLRWCENFNKLLFHSSFLNIAVKKLRKSVNICQSYRKNESGTFFMDRGVVRPAFCSLHYPFYVSLQRMIICPYHIQPATRPKRLVHFVLKTTATDDTAHSKTLLCHCHRQASGVLSFRHEIFLHLVGRESVFSQSTLRLNSDEMTCVMFVHTGCGRLALRCRAAPRDNATHRTAPHRIRRERNLHCNGNDRNVSVH